MINKFPILYTQVNIALFGRCTDPKNHAILWVDNAGRFTKQEFDQAEKSRVSWR